MKMTQAISKSVYQNDRFKIHVGGKNNKNKDANISDSNNGENK